MEHDFMARGYLLPPGCKDLIDVLNLKAKLSLSPAKLDYFLGFLKKHKPKVLMFEWKQPFPKHPAPLPPIVGQVVVPAETTAAQLAAILRQKPIQIVADVMDLGFFVGAQDPLSFEIISSVARKHGFFAIRADS
jgi:hypothetical protein